MRGGGARRSPRPVWCEAPARHRGATPTRGPRGDGGARRRNSPNLASCAPPSAFRFRLTRDRAAVLACRPRARRRRPPCVFAQVPAYGALGVVPIMLVTCYAKSFWTSLTFYLLHFLLAEVRREDSVPR